MGVMGVVSADPEIRVTKRGNLKLVFLSVDFGMDDIRSVQYLGGPGVDRCPVKGDLVCVEDYGGIPVAVAAGTAKDAEAKPGELLLYVRDKGGAVKSSLRFTENGEAEITIGDNAIRVTSQGININNGALEVAS